MPSTPAVLTPAPPIQAVQAGVRGTYIAFLGSGFAFASWASRIPQVRDHLRLSPARLGLVLLCIAAGSMLALPLSGPVVHRFGSRRTVAGMAALLAIGLATVSLGYLGGLVPVAVGLFVMGFANGAWDVAMNVQGALVERHLGRSIMSRFHAGYSLGTVAGRHGRAARTGHRAPASGGDRRRAPRPVGRPELRRRRGRHLRARGAGR
jgi:MFS family permease